MQLSEAVCAEQCRRKSSTEVMTAGSLAATAAAAAAGFVWPMALYRHTLAQPSH